MVWQKGAAASQQALSRVCRSARQRVRTSLGQRVALCSRSYGWQSSGHGWPHGSKSSHLRPHPAPHRILAWICSAVESAFGSSWIWCTYRGSERKSVSHPASGCLRGIEETQEGTDPQGTGSSGDRPTQRGAPHNEGATHTRGATHTGNTQTDLALRGKSGEERALRAQVAQQLCPVGRAAEALGVADEDEAQP